MSRLELIYTVNSNAVRLLNRLGLLEHVPQDCVHYLNEDDLNNAIYRCRREEAESRLQRTIDETTALKQALEATELTEQKEYEHQYRVLRDQTDAGEGTQCVPKDKQDIRSDSLQNPSDPDATFRLKAGESYKDYVGNVVEMVNEEGLGINRLRFRFSRPLAYILHSLLL